MLQPWREWRTTRASLYLQSWQRRRRSQKSPHLDRSLEDKYGDKDTTVLLLLSTAVDCVVTTVLVLKGNKRQAVEESSGLASSSSSSPESKPSGGRSLPLKARYGIHAWKRWALSASDQLDNAKGKGGSKPGWLSSQLSSYSSWLVCIVENLKDVFANSLVFVCGLISCSSD